MKYEIIDEIGIMPKGILGFQIEDKKGNVIDSYQDSNVVVLTSRNILIKRIFENLPQFEVSRIKIGSDVGTGTSEDPQEPDNTIVSSDMDVLFDTTENFSVNYSGDLDTTYSILISGEDVLDQYPGEESIQFTSMGLVSRNDILFSYRRFPARTITRNFNVNIFWNIYYEE